MAGCSPAAPGSRVQTDLCRSPFVHARRVCLLCAVSLSQGVLGTLAHWPALSGMGAGALALGSPAINRPVMWEVTTQFATTLQAAGLNVSSLLTVSKGHGTSHGRERHSPHRRSEWLGPGRGRALSIFFVCFLCVCGLNKMWWANVCD